MAQRRDRRETQLAKRRTQRARGGSGTPSWVGPAIIAAVLVLGGFGLKAAGVFDPPPKAVDLGSIAAPAGAVGTHMPDASNGHVATGEKVTYAMLPPTSGPHWDLPHGGWGVKDQQIDDERVVHNLEHGGISIQYKDLSADDLAKLKTLVRQLSGGEFRKVLLRPYSRMDKKLVLTAWNWRLDLDAYDETKIVQFVRAHYGSAGESPEPNST